MSGANSPAVPQAAARAACLAAAGLCACALPRAALGEDGAALRFELAPYTAYRFGGEFEDESSGAGFDLHNGDAHGLLFDIATERGDTQWEVLYARQRTKLETGARSDGGPLLDVDAEYLQAGGTYLFDTGTRRPFIALTLGAARFAPRPPALDDEIYLSASLGGGVQLRALQRLGVRIEGRAFASAIDSDGELFCAGGGLAENAVYRCAVSVEGSTLLQWEARVGLVFRF